MATINLSAHGYKHYSGGWEGWSTSEFYDGYAGGTTYATVIRYKIPTTISYFAPPYEITLEIPWIRQSGLATSGKFTIRLFTSDPTTTYTPATISNSDASGASKPSQAKATASWSASNLELHTSTFNFTYNPTVPTETTYFYIWVYSTETIEVGWSNKTVADQYFMTIDYSAGGIWINTTGAATGWKQAIVWVNIDGTASGWKKATPWINIDGTASGWKRGGG